jgi:pyrimidine oxygenase
MRFTGAATTFCLTASIPPTARRPQRLIEAGQRAGRDVGTYVLMMIIADETDEAAMAKWQHYKAGTDVKALDWMFDQAGADVQASEHSMAKAIVVPEGAVNFNMGTLVGSYGTVARMLDEAARSGTGASCPLTTSHRPHGSASAFSR